MSRRLPTREPATRILYYPEPQRQAPMVPYTPEQLAEQRQERALAYAQWLTRFEASQERERRTRRLLIRAALVVLAVLLIAVALLVWFVYQAITGMSLEPLADVGGFLLGLLVLLLVIGGGCGCITIVQHYH
ncbi:hypothetical protein Val02_14060 [Virgisporangium aliadipatigenens]|uniref:Uncharacterized protein n=1 Tax=Virgisporangium aliadipatigenens TaxID=741659 RepID=A0A8J3YID8_9ACTN|nr:hypothetical protein [Virgisporangium aliadipatigenens]GIJ44520.1 hypothetical protein Val02_14060 [Virgisporangium aliadipatigenens]